MAGRRRDRDRRRGARVAQHRVRRVERAQGQQHVHSWHRGQPRRDDLYRRRPAAPTRTRPTSSSSTSTRWSSSAARRARCSPRSAGCGRVERTLELQQAGRARSRRRSAAATNAACRAPVSGPLSSTSPSGPPSATAKRDGFTTNNLTGRASIRASLGRAQLLWVPTANWETRLIVSGERARGDYALNDLDALRKNPFHASRDFEGHGKRDIWTSTLLIRREGRRVGLLVHHGVRQVVDRQQDPTWTIRLSAHHTEQRGRDRQIAQSRLASAARDNLRRGSSQVADRRCILRAAIHPGTGRQRVLALRVVAVLALPWPSSSTRRRPRWMTRAWGRRQPGGPSPSRGRDAGRAGQSRAEDRRPVARITARPSLPAPRCNADRAFSDVSPQAAVAWRDSRHLLTPRSGAASRPAASTPHRPRAAEYGEERAWNAEGGLKTTWADGRMSLNAAGFRISWDDMQLNVPNPYTCPRSIANVGHATSTLEARARPHRYVELFRDVRPDAWSLR